MRAQCKQVKYQSTGRSRRVQCSAISEAIDLAVFTYDFEDLAHVVTLETCLKTQLTPVGADRCSSEGFLNEQGGSSLDCTSCDHVPALGFRYYCPHTVATYQINAVSCKRSYIHAKIVSGHVVYEPWHLCVQSRRATRHMSNS